MRNQVLALCAILAGLSIGTCHAALLSQASGQAWYDTDLNITWVADANLARTSGWDTDGRMTWAESEAWIAHLNAIAYLGVASWRLPKTTQPDTTCSTVLFLGQYGGPNCIGSEMGQMFYVELGGVAGQTLATTHSDNYNLFTNIQASNYWSETRYAVSTAAAWDFNFLNGYQGFSNTTTTNRMYAWAVSGDTVVPIPATMWLFGSSLSILGLMRRR